MSETFTHRPVLLNECIQALNIRPEGVYLDGTLGRAGHSREIARRLTTGRLICVDRDQAALEAAEERLAQWRDRVNLVHGNFDQIDRILNELSLSGADGMLFDLGVSSPQLDDSTRGFSYMADAPLDMRMDQSGGDDRRRRWSTSGRRRSCGASCTSMERSGMPPRSPPLSSGVGRTGPSRPPWSWRRSSGRPCLPGH